MCSGGESRGGAIEDDGNAKRTATRLFGSPFFCFFLSKFDRNLLQNSLAIKAGLWNSGSLRLARTRNAYIKKTDFSFDFGIKIDRFCLLRTTLMVQYLKSKIQQDRNSKIKITVPFRPTLRSQVTATLEEKTSTICHRSQRRSKRWTEIFGACGAPFIAYY